jgi:basic membrane lipoprotein Med (substrate-binding protein (PBP1-ABC) superfamily)
VRPPSAGRLRGRPGNVKPIQNFLDQGADIVMPVAGPSARGQAALLEAKAAGKDIELIWVDSDGFLTAPDYEDIMLSGRAEVRAGAGQEGHRGRQAEG